MDIVTTSLDALLHKATNAYDQNIDAAATEAFCALINKEKDGPHIGAKLLAMRIHSRSEMESLNTLIVIDASMKRCNGLHSEIGKFRFLNEMIKLVSPKYLGSQTPPSVKQKVLQLLYIWTVDYPKETKIKEAYDMLKKQGVIREAPLSVCADNASFHAKKMGNSIFHDEEKNRLLQKLLQSKNPEDLQAANRLIKNMVREDDKRAELKSRRITELESVHNNARLLNEMLDSYKPGISSEDELELIRELHQSCIRLRPNVCKLAAETKQNEEMLGEVLQASEELTQVFDKYSEIIIKGNLPQTQTITDDVSNLALLDLASPLLESGTTTDREAALTMIQTEPKSEMDLLCDIFHSTTVPDEILKPISSPKMNALSGNGDDVSCKLNKFKALDDLDALGEHLLRENLISKRLGPQFNKVSEKIPMNLLVKQSEAKELNQTNGSKPELSVDNVLNLDLNYLISKENKQEPEPSKSQDLSGDDVLVDITEEKLEQPELACIIDETKNNTDSPKDEAAPIETSQPFEKTIKPSPHKLDVKLSDIVVKLEEVKPSSIPPMVVLDEKNGITVTLHFGKERPREDVIVIVVTTISKNEMPINNYLFQAVVPKNCKLKLQPASGSDLPAYNPFLPPSAITQVMLIANPERIKLSLKFMVSFAMDEETITELGEVDSLPSSLY